MDSTDNSEPRILITGAGGQLGSELTAILKTGQAELGEIPQIFRRAVVFATDTHNLDITDATAVSNYVESNGINLIVNCAAMTNVDACETNADTAQNINVNGAANLAIAAQANDAVLIHISTDYVFKGDIFRPLTESDNCDPQGVYGRSKLLSELRVAELCRRHFIVRSAWMFGATGPNFVLTIAERAKTDGAIKVVSDQTGSPTSANDLAYMLLKLALTKDYGIYHCTNSGSSTWFEFALWIVSGLQIDCTKTPCATADFPRLAPRPAYSVLDNTRLRETIGEEMRPWQDALDSYLQRDFLQQAYARKTGGNQ